MSLPSHDAFVSATDCQPLVQSLRERIALDGRITFCDFMDAALYAPEHGYYVTQRRAATRGGDFVTSPEAHAVFGALVARQIWQTWDMLGRPAPFDIVEPGGGAGTLARQILEWARHEPAFAAAIRYTIVEPHEIAASDKTPTGDIEWTRALPESITGCVLSNEFFDALPVHRVKQEDATLLEVYVTVADDRFVETLDAPSTPQIGEYFERVGAQPGDGCFAEVNLAAERWMNEIARRLDCGYVLTFDYGYETSDLYASWRRDGTLRCFYRQSISSDPYQRVGLQDMTSTVDFTALRDAAEGAGLRTLGFTDQSQFLAHLGIGDGIASVVRDGANMEEYFARRNVVLDLIDPARLGRIKVLLQGKNVPDLTLAGFADGR